MKYKAVRKQNNNDIDLVLYYINFQVFVRDNFSVILS